MNQVTSTVLQNIGLLAASKGIKKGTHKSVDVEKENPRTVNVAPLCLSLVELWLQGPPQVQFQAMAPRKALGSPSLLASHPYLHLRHTF